MPRPKRGHYMWTNLPTSTPAEQREEIRRRISTLRLWPEVQKKTSAELRAKRDKENRKQMKIKNQMKVIPAGKHPVDKDIIAIYRKSNKQFPSIATFFRVCEDALPGTKRAVIEIRARALVNAKLLPDMRAMRPKKKG